MMDETAWLVANRLASTHGIFDNLVSDRREMWENGEMVATCTRPKCTKWGHYRDHPFNKAKP